MLYADAAAERTKFDQFDFTLSWGMSGNTFFLNRAEALEQYCNYVTEIYTGKNRYAFDRMLYHFVARRRNRLSGGACDMMAFSLYSEMHFGEVGEAAQIIDASLFDPGIAAPNPGPEMSNGIKKIVWKNSLPYGRHLRTGQDVRFNSLHFTERENKSLMAQFYTGHSAMIAEPWRPVILNGGIYRSSGFR